MSGTVESERAKRSEHETGADRPLLVDQGKFRRARKQYLFTTCTTILHPLLTVTFFQVGLEGTESA